MPSVAVIITEQFPFQQCDALDIDRSFILHTVESWCRGLPQRMPRVSSQQPAQTDAGDLLRDVPGVQGTSEGLPPHQDRDGKAEDVGDYH